MVLFLIASGLSLILGVMGILNLAHGALYLLGAYVGLTILPALDNFWASVIFSGLGVGVLGVFLQRFLLSRIHGKFNEQALLTLGIVYIMTNAIIWIWGPYAKMGDAPLWLDGSVAIGSLQFPVYRFAIIAIGIIVFGVLWWLQDKTRAGAIVRAGMDDQEMTRGLGINYALVCSAVFFLGAFLAGAAGMLASPWLGAEYRMALPILLTALIAIVLGGVGTVQGTLVGALIIGMIEAFSKAFIPEYSYFMPYVAFVIILMVRPQGLLGRKQ
jgi:branched-chain amino acid transport system permease protein